MSARRRYLAWSVVLGLVWGGLTLFVTLRFGDAPQLGLGQIAIPALLWAFFVWMVWTLRKGYIRLKGETHNA